MWAVSAPTGVPAAPEQEFGNRGRTMVSDEVGAGAAQGPADEEAALEAALQEAPRGAVAVAGVAVLLLLAGWFFVYLFIFLPRGSVG